MPLSDNAKIVLTEIMEFEDRRFCQFFDLHELQELAKRIDSRLNNNNGKEGHNGETEKRS